MKAQGRGWVWEFRPRYQDRRWPEEPRTALESGGLRGPVSLLKVGRAIWTLQSIWGLNKSVPSRGTPRRKGLDIRVEAQVHFFLTSSLQSGETETQKPGGACGVQAGSLSQGVLDWLPRTWQKVR